MSKFLIQAFLSGVLIGLGDIIYVTQTNHILGSFLFSLGLLSILVKGYPLYTGRIGYIANTSDIFQLKGGMLSMLLLNLVGIGSICYFCSFSKLDTSCVIDIVSNKFTQSHISCFFLSYCCGVMMYLAVNGWKNYYNPIYVIIPIMFFILCGFEHCIANFGYLCLYISKYGFDIPSGTLINFILMVIGNGIGSLTFSKI